MTKSTCEFIFDNNPNKVYFGGQTLSGIAILTLNGEKTLRGIYVEIKGKASSRWTEGTGDSSSSYSGQECYLNEKTLVIGNGEDEITIPSGVHKFTFHCLLPALLPTSVEAKQNSDSAYIRYSVIVSLVRPLWKNKNFEEAFTVIKPLNLNDDPMNMCAVSNDMKKHFSYCCLCCCCTSKPLFMYGKMPLAGYTPGQVIPIEITVNNKSHLKVNSLVLNFNKVVTLYVDKIKSKKRKHIIKLNLIEEHLAGCEANKLTLQKVFVSVPPVPPTDISTSKIITVEYEICIKSKVACCHTDPVLVIPVTIGTSPINMPPITLGNNLNANANNFADTPALHVLPYSSQAMNATYSDQDSPPPTYEEAISGKINIDGKSFAPLYPVYRK